LDALERGLGVKLFSRTRDGMQLAPAGQEVLEGLDRVALELEAITRRLQARDASLAGAVSLSAPELLLAGIAPAFEDFVTEYPDLRLDLHPLEYPSGPESMKADLMIRITSSPPPDLIGRNLGSYRVGIYGVPALLNGEMPEAAAERVCWIDSPQAQANASELKRRYRPGAESLLVSESGSVRLAALRAGLGIGPLPCLVGDLQPDLVRAPPEPVEVGELWLLSHPDLRRVAKVQALSEFLQFRLRPRM
jgi:DNA-binding transcriptional LysR family regulator